MSIAFDADLLRPSPHQDSDLDGSTTYVIRLYLKVSSLVVEISGELRETSEGVKDG